MENLTNYLKETLDGIKDDFPLSISFILIILGSIFNIIATISPFAYIERTFGSSTTYSIFKSNWVEGLLILFFSITAIFFATKKRMIVSSICAILSCLYFGGNYQDFSDNRSLLTIEQSPEVGIFLGQFGTKLVLAGVISYLIMRYFLKMKLNSSSKFEINTNLLKNKSENILSFFIYNLKRPMAEKLMFFGLLLTSLSVFLPFLSHFNENLGGEGTLPAISISPIISIILLITNFISYKNLENIQNKKVYLALFIDIIAIIFFKNSMREKISIDTTIDGFGFGYSLYLLGIAVLIIGSILKYKKEKN